MRRLIRAVRILARDGRIPRPLRWLAAVGLLPVPGPFDEAVLLPACSVPFSSTFAVECEECGEPLRANDLFGTRIRRI